MSDRSALTNATNDQCEHIDPSAWDDVWIVGDVHGCIAELRRLVDRLEPDENDLVVFVGDLVRKGPDSAAVCSYVRERENFRSVRGNNEGKVLRGDAAVPDLSATDEAFLGSLPVALEIGDAVVVHGGIDHRKPLEAHTVEELLTTRSLVPGGSYDRPYWFERRIDGRRVYFGHTVLSNPLLTPWAVGLDTGCVYGGALTAVHFDTDEVVAVEPSQPYEDRSVDNVVEPRRPTLDRSR